MLEMFVVREAVFILTGVMIGIGFIARVITGISLKKMVKAASNMSKSTHPLMRLVRAKFEHGCMVSDKVQNVDAFVEKYLYEYRVLGVKLHTWRQWTKGSIWLCILLGAGGTALAYLADESRPGMYRYGILGAGGAAVLFLFRMLSDDSYQMEAAKTYMVDFLENTYAHRYAKTNQKEIQVTVQRADEAEERNMTAEERTGTMPQNETAPRAEMRPEIRNEQRNEVKEDIRPEIKTEAAVPVNAVPVRETAEELEPTKEARIREILEEFLA